MKTILTFLLLAFVCIALADDAKVPQYDKDYAKVDKELDVVYKAVLKKIQDGSLPPDAPKQYLAQQKQAQRAWIEFRDEEAKLSEYRVWRAATGHVEHMDSAMWKTRLTRDRTQQLRDHFDIKK